MKLEAKIKQVLNTEKAIKAFADVIIDDSVVIHDVGVGENEKGRFITMPRKKWTNKLGEEQKSDVCHPISSSARKEIEKVVFAAYDESIRA